MPGATVGLISQIWVGKLPMKWMLGVSKMPAGAATTKVTVLLNEYEPLT